MSTIIDWHSHWIPTRVFDLLSKRKTNPRIVTNSRGETILLAQPWAAPEKARPLTAEWHDIELRLRHLDRAGVDRQLLSWPTTNQVDAFLPAEDARVIWSAYNEELAQVVKKRGDRFFGVAILPTSDIEWAARELERAHRDLGLIGAVLPVGAFQTLEAALLFAPVFEVAQKYRSHLYLHTGPAAPAIPGQPPNTPHPEGDVPLIRWSLDTGASFAAGTVTLTQTGFLDSYPDVTVQIAMLGGSISFLAESIELRARGLHGTFEKKSPLESFRRVYFDSGVIGRGPHALELAVKTFGADRILFGTDFPPLPTLDKTVAAFDQADLNAQQREQILSGNALHLLREKDRKPEAASATV
jgi:predicted TIM-barrel fold metal-dependent hydrolase